jgi:hypothetical protein
VTVTVTDLPEYLSEAQLQARFGGVGHAPHHPVWIGSRS